MEIRDLESLRPLVASSLRSAATAQGPRLSKSRISTDSLYNLYLYRESVEIRDLESRGPWAVAAERSEDATKGPRLSKSRISIGRAV